MKIVFGLVAVLLALLGMVAGLYHLDNPSNPDSTDGAVGVVDDGPMTGVEKAYLEFAITHLQTVGDDISSLGVLFSNPELENEYWQASAATLLNRIELADASLSTVTPTARLQPFQDAAMKALGQATLFVKVLRGMLVEGTTELTDEAAQALYATGDAFEEADRLLGEFLEAHPVPEELK